jgi:hypothetical protein
MGWNELATKQQGPRRSLSRPPYFSRDEIQAGMAYASEAIRLAEANADEYRRDVVAETSSSEARSTTDLDASNSPSEAK